MDYWYLLMYLSLSTFVERPANPGASFHFRETAEQAPSFGHSAFRLYFGLFGILFENWWWSICHIKNIPRLWFVRAARDQRYFFDCVFLIWLQDKTDCVIVLLDLFKRKKGSRQEEWKFEMYICKKCWADIFPPNTSM